MLLKATSSHGARLRADRMGRRSATIRPVLTSVMGSDLRQEICAKPKSGNWRRKNNLCTDVSFEEWIDAALAMVEPVVDGYTRKIFENNDASRKAIEKIIEEIPKDPVTKRLAPDEAEKTYTEQVTEVDNGVK